jgi:signal-transduction protein with cAMP-binding, CBS, and nucleotidyltransferase domain
MIAPDLISHSIPPVQITDLGERALVAMHEYNVSQLAVINDNKYEGLVTIDEIINLKNLSKPLKDLRINWRKPFVYNTAHIFDVMKAAVEFNVRVVPVVDEEENYLGLISAESCLRAFAVLNSVSENGAVLEIETSLSNYSLSELARMAEQNDATILCMYTNAIAAEGRIEITIKLNTSEVNSLVATLERFEYSINAIHNDSHYTEELKDRYDSLMRYLNV